MELVEAVERSLAAADALETIAGQAALVLAARMGSPVETGSAVAALSRELSGLVAAAVRSAPVSDPLDELRRRRDRKRRAVE